jgi:hypothetical protein
VRIRDIRIPYVSLLIVPALLWFLGYTMNATVIAANGGVMPVQGYTECVGHAAEERGDTIHACMDKASHLKIFADWVWTPSGTASLGDALEYGAEYIMYPCLFIWLGLMLGDWNKPRGKDTPWY